MAMSTLRAWLASGLACITVLAASWCAMAQQCAPLRAKLGQPAELVPGLLPQPIQPVFQPITEPKSAVPAATPSLPISLPAALQLANARPIDIQLAQQRLAVANALLQRAELLWLPSIYLGF